MVSSVTVYVPARVMATESPAAGTRPRLQFDALLHAPPDPFVHDSVLALIVNGGLVAAVRLAALAVSV